MSACLAQWASDTIGLNPCYQSFGSSWQRLKGTCAASLPLLYTYLVQRLMLIVLCAGKNYSLAHRCQDVKQILMNDCEWDPLRFDLTLDRLEPFENDEHTRSFVSILVGGGHAEVSLDKRLIHESTLQALASQDPSGLLIMSKDTCSELIAFTITLL